MGTGGGAGEGEQPTRRHQHDDRDQQPTCGTQIHPRLVHRSLTGAHPQERNDAPNHAIYSKLAREYRCLLLLALAAKGVRHIVELQVEDDRPEFGLNTLLVARRTLLQLALMKTEGGHLERNFPYAHLRGRAQVPGAATPHPTRALLGGGPWSARAEQTDRSQPSECPGDPMVRAALRWASKVGTVFTVNSRLEQSTLVPKS